MPLERKCRLGVLVLVLILMLGFYGAGRLGRSRFQAARSGLDCALL